jgi:hypothetical protein
MLGQIFQQHSNLPLRILQLYNYNLFKNRSCSQGADLQRLNFTKEMFKLIILFITDKKKQNKTHHQFCSDRQF